jgi:predicted RNase H-like HicB family nuclease
MTGAAAAMSQPGPPRLTAVVLHEGRWHVARCVEVEVVSQGRTIASALGNLREALELYFEDEPAPATLRQ